jgi:MYXO-CTERM domain-containing protein
MSIKTSFHRPLKTSLAALAVGGMTALFAADAAACGGLFCNSANPVNQAAERIIFAQNDDGTVTAAIEILYEGPSESFAWVLPVPPGEIDVKVSSKQALDALQQASNPIYRLNVSVDEGCAAPQLANAGGSAGVSDPTTAAPSAAEADDAPAVEVVASGNTGPYSWEQIEVNPDLDDREQVAVDWLEKNGYDALDPETLRPYLDENMNLVAFKLTKNAGQNSGSVRPILITYQGDNPTIPIRPTAVAANEDMGVMTWVLGEERAIPTSYYHLELNEAHINWFNAGPTYNDVIIAAADEAGGNGFVTEQSGPAATFSETIYPSWKDEQWQTFRTGQFDSIESFLMSAQTIAQAPFINAGGGFAGPLGAPLVASGQPVYDGWLDLMSDPEVVPLREGATPEGFLACMSCYFESDVAVRTDAYPSTDYDPETDPLLDMDVPAFLDKMEELVIQPLADTAALFDDHEHVTRFYTTLSPDEMIVDPVFDFKSGMKDVDNNHVADQIMQCSEDQTDWRIELPQGQVIEGDGTTWPVTLESGMPLNFRVVQLSTMGSQVIDDNSEEIAEQLVSLGVGDINDDFEMNEDPGGTDDTTTPPEAVDITDPESLGDEPAADDPSATNEDPRARDDNASGEGDSATEDAIAAMTDGIVDDMEGDDGKSRSSSDGGCSIASTGTKTPFSPAWLLALGALLLRRRRGA